MEPNVSECNGKAPLAVWGADSPATPLLESAPSLGTEDQKEDNERTPLKGLPDSIEEQTSREKTPTRLEKSPIKLDRKSSPVTPILDRTPKSSWGSDVQLENEKSKLEKSPIKLEKTSLPVTPILDRTLKSSCGTDVQLENEKSPIKLENPSLPVTPILDRMPKSSWDADVQLENEKSKLELSPIKLEKTFSDDSEGYISTPFSCDTSPLSFNNNGSLPYADGVKFVTNVDDYDKDSICSSDSGSSGEEESTKFPDGGWGWVIVMSSLIISMVADGISFSFGLMFNQFLIAFGESKAKTAWIGGLFMAVPLLSGPIMSAFVDRYGCKVGTMVGGVISGLGFVLAVFGNSVEYEYMTFGVIAGLGLGLCYVTAVVAVCQWFEKKRALATGLGACGTGFGTFVYAPMTQYFIEEYGWRGTTLLLSGTFLQMCVCGAVMRDPQYLTDQREERKAESIARSRSRAGSSCGSVSGAESQFPGSDEIRNMLKSGKKPEDILSTLAENIKLTNQVNATTKENGEVHPRICHSVVDIPTQFRTVPLENILEDEPGLLTCKSSSDQGKLNELAKPNRALSVKRQRKQPIRQQTIDGPPAMPLIDSAGPPVVVAGLGKARTYFQRQFSFSKPPQSNYLKNMRVHRKSIMYRGATLTTGRYHLKASSCPNIFRNSMTTLAKEQDEKWYTETVELIKTIFNFSYFLELHFFLISVAIILLFTFFIVPYFYLINLMTDNGYSGEEGSRVLAYIGLVNAFGMIFFGWVGDQPWVNVAKLFAGCMLACGTCCIITPMVVSNYWLMNLSVWGFGLFFASSYSLTPPLIVELIPVEKFTTAYGLILLCQGIGNLVGPSIAGFIYDITEVWDIPFYLAGVGIIICGCLIAIIPVTKNCLIIGKGMLEMDRLSQA